MIKPIGFSRTIDMDHLGLKVYKVYINVDSGVTMTYFTAISNLAKSSYCALIYQTNSQVSVYMNIGPLVFCLLMVGFM